MLLGKDFPPETHRAIISPWIIYETIKWKVHLNQPLKQRMACGCPCHARIQLPCTSVTGKDLPANKTLSKTQHTAKFSIVLIWAITPLAPAATVSQRQCPLPIVTCRNREWLLVTKE